MASRSLWMLLAAVCLLKVAVCEPVPPSQLVLIGATGDLARKYTLSAAFNLWASTKGSLRVYAVGRHADTEAIVRNALGASVMCASSIAKTDAECQSLLSGFLETGLSTHAARTLEEYQALAKVLDADVQQAGVAARRAFHLAVPPSALPGLAQTLTDAFLVPEASQSAATSSTLMIEKPLGRDAASADATLAALKPWAAAGGTIGFVDHYLAKAGVSAIVAFRAAAGPRFASLWHWSRLNHVEVVAEESADVDARVAFYEDAGGYLRDMAQNHLTEIAALATAAIEVPVSAVELSDALAAAEVGANGEVQAGTTAERMSWRDALVQDTTLLDEGGRSPPVASASNGSAAAEGWRAVAAASASARVSSKSRVATLSALRPAMPLNKDNVALVLGQYAGYRQAVAAAAAEAEAGAGETLAVAAASARTPTAARVSFAFGSASVRGLADGDFLPVAAPDLLGVPLVMAGGKRLGRRRALARLDFGPRGRLTMLVHGDMPVVLSEADARASGLPLWPADAEDPSLTVSQSASVREIAGSGARIVNVTGPAVVMERPVAHNTQMPLPAAVPASMQVVAGGEGGNATTFIALLRSRADLLASARQQQSGAAWPALDMTAASRLFAQLQGGPDAYSAVFAEALSPAANRHADDVRAERRVSASLRLFVSAREVRKLWALWEPVLRAADDSATPVRVYNEGDRWWAGLGEVSTIKCHDKACCLSPASEWSKWVSMMQGGMPPMLREMATDRLVQEREERQRKRKARAIRRRREAARRAAKAAAAGTQVAVEAVEIEQREGGDVFYSCIGTSGALEDCEDAFDGPRPKQPAEVLDELEEAAEQ